jgi:hypothetical protein
MNAHLTWDTLNDYADNVLTREARATAAQHLDACGECRDSLARLQTLITAATSVQRDVPAPIDAWTTIKTRVEHDKVVALPAAQHTPPARRKLPLIAAAAALVIASSATTALIMQQRQPAAATIASADTTLPATLPASLVSLERGYLETVTELTAALNAGRERLAPETVRSVERSLKVIDDAIAEARLALLRDPASEMLRDMLSKVYEQKVDLLRRASARASTT